MVGKMENGTRYPDLTSLPAIASVLRIDLTLLTLCFLNQRAPEIADAFRRTMHKPRIIHMLEALPRALKTTVHDMIQDLYREEISLAQTAKRA